MFKALSLIIPTLNAGSNFELLLQSIKKQSIVPHEVIVIDSESDDATPQVALKYGCSVISIRRKDFNHGATRQFGVERSGADIVVFLTQDTILASASSLKNIIDCFNDPTVGAAYGRQLPHLHSSPIGAHARLFNYPPESRIKTMGDAAELGIKTAFISNSFAAYRRAALQEVGGFPANVILSEDTYVAAKMLLAGWKVYYSADAQVYHSHDYTVWQEFKRYFDIGVFHGRESWLREAFGQAEGEGFRYVCSELRYLWVSGKRFIPKACLQNLAKLVGYKLGLHEKLLPRWVKKRLSANKQYWAQA
ncbi:glycosyl transferase, family 2 [Thermosinus carboxydivorans Nor1]|uniref:Glycosyl transferase, family 2 n=1 Tax=Thermosinus carboxydivorans Nor1 TaxID=401526 RepID=A1HMB6_9FIRM|nr:glycosyltransferase family 2 protein [Thermosinus carboxydivorans]EAX48960.1 glycosyl transferase, family 2 [Thermosinus carboxydivorans Nor1]